MPKTPIKHVPKNHIQENDSGICSDINSASMSKYSNLSTNKKSTSSAALITKSSSSNNVKKLEMLTPIVPVIMTNATTSAAIGKINEKPKNKSSSNNNKISNLLFSHFRNSKSKSRTDLLNLRRDSKFNSEHSLNVAQAKSHSFLDKINIFTRIKHSSKNESTQKTEFLSPQPNMKTQSIETPDSKSNEQNSPVNSYDSAIQDCENEQEDEQEDKNVFTNIQRNVQIMTMSQTSASNFSPAFYDLTTSPPSRVLENKKLFDNFALNMHRIDKDVVRCDRNYWFFTNQENLDRLKNIIYTYDLIVYDLQFDSKLYGVYIELSSNF
jgi:hypothetical protein